MTLAQLQTALADLDRLDFTLPDGSRVPRRFHVTEVGRTDKRFLDCGGTLRSETRVTLQLWAGPDLHHRLAPAKLAGILAAAQRTLDIAPDTPVEVEYQGDTAIQRFTLGADTEAGQLRLGATATDCLAKGLCDVTAAVGARVTEAKDTLVAVASSCCAPGAGGGQCC